MNRNPFTDDELKGIRESVEKAIRVREETGVMTVDSHPWLIRAIATIDALKAKLPIEAPKEPQGEDA